MTVVPGVTGKTFQTKVCGLSSTKSLKVTVVMLAFGSVMVSSKIVKSKSGDTSSSWTPLRVIWNTCHWLIALVINWPPGVSAWIRTFSPPDGISPSTSKLKLIGVPSSSIMVSELRLKVTVAKWPGYCAWALGEKATGVVTAPN